MLVVSAAGRAEFAGGHYVLLPDAAHVFTAVERESVLGLGRLASSVIATAQMYDSQRRRRLESEFLAEAGAILIGSLDYRDTL